MSNQSEVTVSSITRHTQYYFPDGSLVLQVGGVLFKVQASLLAQESKVFRDMSILAAAQHAPNIHDEHGDSNGEGCCDGNPIIISGVSPFAFKNFIFMFYGRPTDPEFLAMMTDSTTTTENHSTIYFNQYLDIADLSHRFAAPRLEA
ncbi:hypothetical protein BDV93DRAFT_558355 [Ceratobasidium sp. AG-I]|nr:hypothetical protein BDV93DRAFT_558355 [Ceratobasidium sp. AG-I]